MKKRLPIVVLLLSFFMLRATTAEPAYRITIRPDIQFQTIDHFGASDCWSVQHMGITAPAKIKELAADLLFSTQNDRKGNPKGIGLSLWRFNIGAGSAENPVNQIGNPWRRTPCMLDTTGRFDSNKQAGQVWFVKAAKKRGCPYFLGFCNSPPYFMTQNGQSFNIGRTGHTLNLKTEHYPSFARFLADVYQSLKKDHGISLNYLSPFNEPEWAWRDPNQEGTPCSVEEMARFYRTLDSELTCRKVNKLSIVGTECAHFKYLYSTGTDNPAVENQIDRLFNPHSGDYIGNLPHMEPVIAAHSYWTTQLPDLIRVRQELNRKRSLYPIKFWQSEVCIMSNDREIGGGAKRDLGMETALYVARIIHHDLTLANASSWQWWLAVSSSDYKDGLLYIDNDTEHCERLYDSRLLWVFGNYSRFIRPGAVRIAVTGDNTDDPNKLMVSAFRNSDGSIAVVVINFSKEFQEITLEGCPKNRAKAYITSDHDRDKLRYLGKARTDSPLRLPARSVTTYLF